MSVASAAMFAQIGETRAFIDFNTPDELAIKLVFKCHDNAPARAAESFKFLMDMGFVPLKEQIESMGAQVDGFTKLDGESVIGEYKLSNVSVLIQ